jgi:hypothetical protein
LLPSHAQQPPPSPPPAPPQATLQEAWLDFYTSQQPQFQMQCGLDLYRFTRTVLEGITPYWFDPRTKAWVKLDQMIANRELVSFQGIGRPLDKLDQLDMNWFAEAAYRQGAPADAPLTIDMQQHIPQRYFIDMQAAYTYSRIMPGTIVRFSAGGRPIAVTLPDAPSQATPC